MRITMNARKSLTVIVVLAAIAVAAAWQKASPSSPPQSVPQAPPGIEEKPQLPEQKHLIDSLDGRILYENYCATCHGKDGSGGGPMAASLKNPVPDLTRIAQRNGGRFPAQRVREIISGENATALAHGSREMPVWGPIFHQIAWDQDLGNIRIYNLTSYLESLQQKSGR
jgi:mono/diheme cytochrome c family protein